MPYVITDLFKVMQSFDIVLYWHVLFTPHPTNTLQTKFLITENM